MDFMKEYEKWLGSPALSEAERAELEAIRNDPKEIESRFYGVFPWNSAPPASGAPCTQGSTI